MNNTTVSEKLPIIVVGTGSVGVHLVRELLSKQADIPIKIFGGEDHQPYDRENLTKLLAGELSEEAIHAAHQLPVVENLQVLLNNPITQIDRQKSEVIDSKGVRHAYKKLVLAVGATPRNLNVEGIKLEHVFVFRDIHDTELLKSRQMASRRTVIIGGGHVGLDVAYAMKRHNTEVTVIEHSSRLMYHQLDDHASVYLRLYLDDHGIEVRRKRRVIRIEGKSQVEHVVLDDGEVIPCDTVIISIGIKPNIELARGASLHINQGIVVNNRLQTNDRDVHAIGECAEYGGRIYGLARPGFEQAEVLAKILTNKKDQYKGSTATTRLKVIDYPILSIGDNGEGALSNQEYMYRDIKRMVYRKLVLNRGHLHGVIAAGKWKDYASLHKRVEKKQYIWPWQRSRFIRTGKL